MKRAVLVLTVLALAMAVAVPAFASQGGISDGSLQLIGGHFMKPPCVIGLFSGEEAVGRAWSALTYCQGFIGYKVSLRGVCEADTVELWAGDQLVACDTPCTRAGEELVLEGIVAYDEVVGEQWFNPTIDPALGYDSILPLYQALGAGEITFVVKSGGEVVASGLAR